MPNRNDVLFDEGIVVTVKQRQEFRIRLQKRARRVAERKLEAFEEERQAKTVSTSLNSVFGSGSAGPKKPSSSCCY